MKPPKLGRGPGSTTGLGALLTSDDDMDACSAAAQAAMSAARLAGYKTSTPGVLPAPGVTLGCCPVHSTVLCMCHITRQHKLKDEPAILWRDPLWMTGLTEVSQQSKLGCP